MTESAEQLFTKNQKKRWNKKKRNIIQVEEEAIENEVVEVCNIEGSQNVEVTREKVGLCDNVNEGVEGEDKIMEGAMIPAVSEEQINVVAVEGNHTDVEQTVT